MVSWGLSSGPSAEGGKLPHLHPGRVESMVPALTQVCLQRSRLSTFHSLKSVVCKACLREDRHIVSRQQWRPHHSGGQRA